jgi:phosphatidylglycerophosphate synthase
MDVGGITVLQRSIKQLGRMSGVKVIVASDGTVDLPDPMPANATVRQLAGDVPAAIASLQDELGNPDVLRGDVVRVHFRRMDGGYRVVDEATRRRAEDAVFADLLRGDLGFVARHINKKISFRITRYLLCKLPVTPNQVTMAGGLIALAGCLLIATGEKTAVLVGFLLAQLQSILDGCDGELARVRLQQTARGEWLDTVVDDLLNIALIGATAVGLWRSGGSTDSTWLALGAAGCAMLLVYMVIAYRELVKQGEGGDVLKIRWWWARGRDFKSLLAGRDDRSGFNLLVALGKRDFFVLAWLVLVILNQLPAVLVYGVVIAAIYFVVAVVQLVARPRPRHNTRST